jgi:hypothetical protein
MSRSKLGSFDNPKPYTPQSFRDSFKRRAFCLDPRPLCWKCGKLAPLKCVESHGWLCLSCRQEQP